MTQGFKSKLKMLAYVVLGASVLIYAVIVVVALNRAWGVRKHPTAEPVIAMFRSEWPHQLLSRLVILKDGSERYNIGIRDWIYQYAQPRDTAINRYLLAQNLMRDFATPPAPPRGDGDNIFDSLTSRLQARAELSSHYPVMPSRKLLHFAGARLQRGEGYFLPILAMDPRIDSRELIANWANTHFTSAEELPLLDIYSELIFKQPGVPTAKLLLLAWTQRHLAPNISFSGMVYAALQAQPAHLATQTDGFYELMAEMMGAEADERSYNVVHMLARLATLEDGDERALAFLREHATRLSDDEITAFASNACEYDQGEVTKSIYKQFAARDARVAAALLHGLAHSNVTAAELLAENVLSGGDSTMRKNAIVVLINHGSSSAAARIDDAFAGSAPRQYKFNKLECYTTGSKATDLYVRLSGHEYGLTGKTWPPSVIPDVPHDLQIEQWRQFVQTYPWFPGTDDAFYRLAFLQYRFGDPNEALATIRAYFAEPERPDRDAEPYIAFLLRAVLAKVPTQDDAPYAQLQVIARTNFAAAMLEEYPNLAGLAAAYDWFTTHPGYVRYLGVEAMMRSDPDDQQDQIDYLLQGLALSRDAAVLGSMRPIGKRLFAVASLLESNRALEQDMLRQVLYGLYFNPEQPRAEYAIPELEELTVPAVTAANLAETKRMLLSSYAAGADGQRRFDVLVWGLLHRRMTGDDSYIEGIRGPVDPSFWSVFAANPANTRVTDALGIRVKSKDERAATIASGE